MEESGSTLEWKQLLEFSKQFSISNEIKLKQETILSELTIFQNLSDLVKDKDMSGNKLLDSLFRFTVQVTPCPALEDGSTTTTLMAENVLISVENISQLFTFGRDFWYFCVDVNCGATATVWRFEKNRFGLGAKERFVTRFNPHYVNSAGRRTITQEIRISLIFSLVFDGRRFQRVLEGKRLVVDILHLLSPGKTQSYVCDRFSPISFTTSTTTSTDDNYNFPPFTSFLIKLNESASNLFPTLFLKDCVHRGFGELCEYEDSKEFCVYFGSDKVELIRCGEDWVVSCGTNPKLLFAVKVCIWKRLLGEEGLKLEAPEEEYIERLERLKLKLEEVDDDLDRGVMQEMYCLLREVSDQLRFGV